jgi:DNA-binding IclR family transcriptional regulator
MGATVIALEESAQAVTLNVRVGSTLPLLTSAMGRVFAAFLPAAVTAPFLAAERDKAKAAQRAVPDAASDARLLDEIRVRRLSRIEGTLLPGLNALAVPVFDYRGKLSSVIGLVGHRDMIDMTEEGAVATELKATAAALSARLGYVDAKAGGAG